MALVEKAGFILLTAVFSGITFGFIIWMLILACVGIRNLRWRRRSEKRRLKYRPDGAIRKDGALRPPHHSAVRDDFFARRLRDNRW
jgi:hypothetical protein